MERMQVACVSVFYRDTHVFVKGRNTIALFILSIFGVENMAWSSCALD